MRLEIPETLEKTRLVPPTIKISTVLLAGWLVGLSLLSLSN